MSQAPKAGYARTQTADGGVQFIYRSARFAPGLPLLMALVPGFVISQVISFGSGFHLMFPALLFMVVYAIVVVGFLNKVERSITVYPDRIVTEKGQAIAFAEVTHIGWETRNNSPARAPASYLYVQTRGVKVNVSGFTKQEIATGLHTEAKLISETSFGRA